MNYPSYERLLEPHAPFIQEQLNLGKNRRLIYRDLMKQGKVPKAFADRVWEAIQMFYPEKKSQLWQQLNQHREQALAIHQNNHGLVMNTYQELLEKALISKIPYRHNVVLWLSQWFDEAGYCVLSPYLPHAHQIFKWYQAEMSQTELAEALSQLCGKPVSIYKINLLLEDLEARHHFQEQQTVKTKGLSAHDPWFLDKLKQGLTLNELYQEWASDYPAWAKTYHYCHMRHHLNKLYGSSLRGKANLFEHRQLLQTHLQEGYTPNRLYEKWVKDYGFPYPRFTFYEKLNKLHPIMNLPWQVWQTKNASTQRQLPQKRRKKIVSKTILHAMELKRYILPHHQDIMTLLAQTHKIRVGEVATQLRKKHPNINATQLASVKVKLNMMYPTLRTYRTKNILASFNQQLRTVKAQLKKGIDPEVIYQNLQDQLSTKTTYHQFSTWLFLVQNDLLVLEIKELLIKLAQYQR